MQEFNSFEQTAFALQEIENSLDNEWKNEMFEPNQLLQEEYSFGIEENSFSDISIYQQTNNNFSFQKINTQWENICDFQSVDVCEKQTKISVFQQYPTQPISSEFSPVKINQNCDLQQIEILQFQKKQSILLENSILQLNFKKVENSFTNQCSYSLPSLPSIPCQAIINDPSQNIAFRQTQSNQKVKEQKETCENSSQSGCSLKSFICTDQKNYYPYIVQMQLLFKQVSKFIQNSHQNIQQLVLYFKLKQKQETKKNLEKTMNEKIKTSEIIQIYYDQKVVLKQFQANKREKNQQQLNKNVKQNNFRCNSLLAQIKQKRIQRQKYLNQKLFNKIEKLRKQLRKKITNKEVKIQTNKYAQRRQLIVLQRQYLNELKKLGTRMISHLNHTFLQEELLIIKNLTAILTNYKQSYQFRYEGNSINNCNFEEESTKEQLKNLLMRWLPEQFICSNQSFTLQSLLQNVSKHLQNDIFMQIIDYSADCYLFQCQGKWKSFSSNQQMKIKVILTSDHYFYLQTSTKQIHFKLMDLILKKRQKQLILTERTNFLASILLPKREIGKIIFFQTQSINKLVKIIKDIINI